MKTWILFSIKTNPYTQRCCWFTKSKTCIQL